MKTSLLFIITFSVAALTRAETFMPDLLGIASGAGWRIPAGIASVIDRDGTPAIHFDGNSGRGLAIVTGVNFGDGTIEFDVRGTDEVQRSFVGVAFHGADDRTFDGVYFRPFNFRSSDPTRRSHAVQYHSLPTRTWQKLRTEHPGKYENAVVPAPDPNDWFHARIVVAWPKVTVFVDDAKEPCLVVEQLSDRKKGWVGLWTDIGGGDFANLRITGTEMSTAPQAPARNLRAILTPYVDELRADVPYLELPDFSERRPPVVVSKRDAFEDIATLEYLWDTAYSGKTYWQSRGIDFAALVQALRAFVNGLPSDSVPVGQFEAIVFEHLRNMTDGHTKIIGVTTHELAKSPRVFFAEVVVEKRSATFVVVDSNAMNIAVGDTYTDSSEHLFRTLSREGTEQYVIGTWSAAPTNELTLTFNHTSQRVRLHGCRINDVAYSGKSPVESREVQSLPVWRVSSFLGRFDAQLKTFVDGGKTLQGRPVVVWDLLGNDGGDASYARRFVENLNGRATGFAYLLTLHSPAVAQAYLPGKNLWLREFVPAEWLRPDMDLASLPPEARGIRREVDRENEDMKRHPRMYWEVIAAPAAGENRFRGKLIVLANNRVGSSGNNALALAQSVPGCVVVGSNSSAGFTFADVVTYSLRNTAIKLRLPKKITVHPKFDNEKGFVPHFWLDSAEPVQEVARWLAQPKDYQFHYSNVSPLADPGADLHQRRG